MKQTMYITCLTTFPACQSGVDKLYILTKRKRNWQLSSADLDASIAHISHATTRQIASRYMYGKTALLIMPHDEGKGSVPTSKIVTFSGDVKTVVYFFQLKINFCFAVCTSRSLSLSLKLRPPQTRKHCCGNIVARNVSTANEWEAKQMFCFLAAQIKKHLGKLCCGRKMFLKKFRNLFCFSDANFVSATNVACARKPGKICVRNNVSATMFPRLRGPLQYMWLAH